MQQKKDQPKDTTVRVDIDLHHQLKIVAALENKTLKDLLEEAITEKIARRLKPPT